MERNSHVEKWVQGKQEVEEEGEEEETLSLCDLPINEDNESRKEASQAIKLNQDDFDFCSLLNESEMCAADEVFFQGQILPLRHSISSENSFSALRSNSHNTNRRVSWSDSNDHCYYSSGFTSGSSRSSSIRSHQSSSSGSSSATNQPISSPRVHKQLHRHPNPRPQINYYSNYKNKNVGNSNQRSTMWSHFRLGLLTTPEIAFHDLKARSRPNQTKLNFIPPGGIDNSKMKPDRKKKAGRFDKNSTGLFSGCKCSVNAVEMMVPSKVVTIRRSASLNEAYSQEMNQLAIKGTKEQQHAGKQALSRLRTFEWLKQLSLDSPRPPNDDHALIQKL